MKKILWSFLEIIETVAIAVVAVVLVRAFVVQPFVVSGASMEPTFYDGNYLLIDELTYRFREPVRGEVVVFRYPGDHKSFYVKRIIGLPGEEVSLENGKVVVSQEEEATLNEDYLSSGTTPGSFEVVLNEDEYFVMGDNRSFSFDSRSWGPVTRDEIVGLVRIRLWPIESVQAFSAPAY